MIIYFVRHGQTEWNKEGKFQGSKDSPLTVEGIFQAECLKERFINENYLFDKVYSSPLGRALSTAKIITNNSYNIEFLDYFKEISVGDMEGIEFEKFKSKYPKEYDDFFHNPTEYNPEEINGETFSSLMLRIKEGLEKIVADNQPDSKILVVTHGITLRGILSYISNNSLDLGSFSDAPVPENTSVTTVNYTCDRFEIESFSNIDHLKQD